MASNFSANQFNREFTARRLCNWEVPKWYPKHPCQRRGATLIISNDRGHLLPKIPRPCTSPWGNFRNTWQLPDKISRKEAYEISAPPVGGSRWKKSSCKKPKAPKTKQRIPRDKHYEVRDTPVIEHQEIGLPETPLRPTVCMPVPATQAFYQDYTAPAKGEKTTDSKTEKDKEATSNTETVANAETVEHPPTENTESVAKEETPAETVKHPSQEAIPASA